MNLINQRLLKKVTEKMITEDAFIKMALSFPSTEQRPHFERIGF